MISAKKARARKGIKNNGSWQKTICKMFLDEINGYIEDYSVSHCSLSIDFKTMRSYSKDLDMCKVMKRLIKKGYSVALKNDVLTIDWSKNNDKKK